MKTNIDRSWLLKTKYFGKPANQQPQTSLPKKVDEKKEVELPSSDGGMMLNANLAQRKLAYKLTGAKIKQIYFTSSTVSFCDKDTKERHEMPLGDWWREMKNLSDGLP